MTLWARQKGDIRAYSALPAVAMVPVLRNQFAVPAPNRFGSDDGGKLVEHLAPEDLTFDGQAPALVVVKEDSMLPELLSEDPILRYEVLDSVLLCAIDPAGKNQE